MPTSPTDRDRTILSAAYEVPRRDLDQDVALVADWDGSADDLLATLVVRRAWQAGLTLFYLIAIQGLLDGRNGWSADED